MGAKLGSDYIDGVSANKMMLGVDVVWSENAAKKLAFDTAYIESTGSVFTFNNIDIGTSSGDRKVIVAVSGYYTSTTTTTLDSVTVAGQAASIVHKSRNTDSGNSFEVAFAIVTLNTGDTPVTVVATYNSSFFQSAIFVWSVEGLNGTPYDTASADYYNESINVNTKYGGLVTAARFRYSASQPPVWVGVEKDADHAASYSPYRYSGASQYNIEDETPRAVKVDLGTTNSASAAVSWQASAVL